MPGETRRFLISVIDSTSSGEIAGLRGLKSRRSRRLTGGILRTPSE
jgi:hypothetical protein